MMNKEKKEKEKEQKHILATTTTTTTTMYINTHQFPFFFQERAYLRAHIITRRLHTFHDYTFFSYIATIIALSR